MYGSRGNNAYGQQQQQQQQQPQPYSGQSAFGQNLGPDGASQMSMASRHSAMLGGHTSSGAHYGGQYTSVYRSMALSSSLQAPATNSKGAGPSTLEGRSGYGSSMQESPKFTSGDYSEVSQKYGQKGEKMFADKLSDYPRGDRHQYVERQGAYAGRDLQNESTAQYADSIAFGHQHQPDIYDCLDAASALRQELLQAQSLQSASIDGNSRQADYLAARAATIRHAGQELLPYGGRMDADPRTLTMISGLSHGGQHAPSILGAAPRREADDLLYTHTSANPGYGVSLPPGRDYASGKGLHSTSLEPDYPGATLARGGYARLDDRKDDLGYERELERRDEERRRELLREREKERERKRERERERERKRERERILEHHEKERDREPKRGPVVRRGRTPPKISRDRGGSSSTKAERSLRMESPRCEALHRHRSPVKEKRREYVCKVYSSSLVDIERDYMSIDKRYPRLFISPECCKVVVNWSRENPRIPFNIPISFEHDFVQEETTTVHKPTANTTDDPLKSERGNTRWNAKMILMSGLSQNALEELSSERNYKDRIPHLCNMLRFACLKDGNSFMAIGGLWDTVDGNDPSVDKSSLVRTALRYAKDLTGLDLKNCQHWNPFLEIHYDRAGKDGLFSHKEVTTLYVPDLSDWLPSIDAWRDQWLAHKKAIAEREHMYAVKRETSREKKEGLKDKESGTTNDLKKDAKPEKKKVAGSPGQASKPQKKGKGVTKLKANKSGKEGEQTNVVEKKDGVETVDEGNNSGKKNQIGDAGVQTTGSGKKKIIRKVIKKKVVAEKHKAGNATKQNDTLDPKNVGGTAANIEATGQDKDSLSNPSAVKTFTRKKATKKVPVVKAVEKEDGGTQSEVISVKEQESSEDKSKNADVGSASVKTTVKKKIIKRVKKKVVSKNANKDKVAEEKEAGTNIGEQSAALGDEESVVKLENNKSVSKTKAQTVVPEKKKDVGGSDETENKGENKLVKEVKKGNVDGGSLSKMKIDNDNQKVPRTDGQSDNNEKSKDREKHKEGKERKDKDGKAESRGKKVKDKKKAEEPPRHPGLFLQTKGSKDSKLRSLSLSLDSLLDYDDNDLQESTFELSLFAETFYEMLQYQMGSRLLTFLQKLRIKFVGKRNQKKRQREEASEKEKEEKISSVKRVKTEDQTVDRKSVKTKTRGEACPEDEKTVVKVENMLTDNVENTKPKEESEEDEDPEEDEEMADASPKNDTENEKSEVVKAGIDAKSEKVVKNVTGEEEGNAKETANLNIKLEGKKKKEKAKVDTKKKETPVSIDKELLQAFRFFDRNRVGYIRVEDMRLIIHNLGKFMSHRDVKELVQSALLESNTGRDDRILYDKLVNMTGI